MSTTLRFVAYTICIILFGIVSRVSGQTRIALTVGLIDNLQQASNQPRYAFYPEVQLLNDFFAISENKASVGGSIYWGYWTDGVDELSSCADCLTYSHSSHIIGTRLIMALNAFPIPVTAFVGISRHFISADYIGGSDLLGNTGSDFEDALNTFEVGLRVLVPVSQNFHVGGNYQHYHVLVKKNSQYSLSRAAASRSSFGIVFTHMF